MGDNLFIDLKAEDNTKDINTSNHSNKMISEIIKAVEKKYQSSKDYKLSKDEKIKSDIDKKLSKTLHTNSDFRDCLSYIGYDNRRELYKYIKKIYKVFIIKSIGVDNSTDKKINAYTEETIGDVTVKTHMYNTNDLMDPIYESLEISFILDFKCENNGLKINKEIKITGSQDFGGCTPEEFRDLLRILRKSY